MERITDEELESYNKEFGGVFSYELVRQLARELLEERKQPKVWDGAPEWATNAIISWPRDKHFNGGEGKCYHRDLPKSPVREIAERVWGDLHSDINKKKEDIDVIESAIKEALALKK
jgi:hypothetical protein